MNPYYIRQVHSGNIYINTVFRIPGVPVHIPDKPFPMTWRLPAGYQFHPLVAVRAVDGRRDPGGLTPAPAPLSLSKRLLRRLRGN